MKLSLLFVTLIAWGTTSYVVGFCPLSAFSSQQSHRVLSANNDGWYADFEEWTEDFSRQNTNTQKSPDDRTDSRKPPQRGPPRGDGGRGRYNEYRRDRSMDNSNVNVAEVERLIEDRTQARKMGDYDRADAIRDELLDDFGVQLWDKEKKWRSGCSRSGSGQRRPGGRFGGADDRPRRRSDDRPRRSGEGRPPRSNEGRRAGPSRDFGSLGHDYFESIDAGPNQSQFDEDTIHNMIAERLQYKLAKNFAEADRIQGVLITGGVYIHDALKEWRADGITFGDVPNSGRPGRERGSRSDRNQPYEESEYSQSGTLSPSEIDTIDDMIQKRSAAKITRNFDLADDIRAALREDYNVFLDDRLRQWSVGGEFGSASFGNQDRNRPWKKSQGTVDSRTEKMILALLDQRSQAKRDRDYDTADSIRATLMEDYGVEVNDRKREWFLATTSLEGGFSDGRSSNKDRPVARRGGGDLTSEDEAVIAAKVQERFEAKRMSDFGKADAIRDELLAEYSVKIDDRNREWRVLSDEYVLSPESRFDVDDEALKYIQEKVRERSQHKKSQNFGAADAIRDELRESYGVSIDDRVREWRVVDRAMRPTANARRESYDAMEQLEVAEDDEFDFEAEMTNFEFDVEAAMTDFYEDELVEEDDDDISEDELAAERLADAEDDGFDFEGTMTDFDEDELVEEEDDDVSEDENTAESKDEDLSSLTVAQLKEKLREAGLPVSGRKAELIERLQTAE